MFPKKIIYIYTVYTLFNILIKQCPASVCIDLRNISKTRILNKKNCTHIEVYSLALKHIILIHPKRFERKNAFHLTVVMFLMCTCVMSAPLTLISLFSSLFFPLVSWCDCHSQPEGQQRQCQVVIEQHVSDLPGTGAG